MPDALTSTAARRSAGVRSSAWTRAVVAESRLEISSSIRRRVHRRLPILAPARLITACAPNSSLAHSPFGLRASHITNRAPGGGGFGFPPRLSTTTWWPSFTRLPTRWRPMKPDPPAIRTFILLLSSPTGVVGAIGPAPDCGGDLRVEAARSAFGAGLCQALRGEGQQRHAIELPALADRHAGIDRQADDLAVRTGRVRVLLQSGSEPVRLPDGGRPIGLGDDEQEPAVLDPGKRVDLPRFRPDHRDELPQNAAEPVLSVLATKHFKRLDLEQHH